MDRLNQRFDLIIDSYRDSRAVSLGSEHYSYIELKSISDALVHKLKSWGIKTAELVAVSTDDPLLHLFTILSLYRMGCSYLPLDPKGSKQKNLSILKRSSITRVVCDANLSAISVEDGIEQVILQRTDLVDDAAPFISSYASGDLGYVIYTDEDEPERSKGVRMSRAALDNLIVWQLSQEDFDQPARTVQFSSLRSDVFFQEMFTTFCSGGCLYLLDKHVKSDFKKLLNFIITNQIERLFLPNLTLLELVHIASRSKLWPTSLQQVITSGAALRVDRNMKDFFGLTGADLFNQYRLLETQVVAQYKLEEEIQDWLPSPPIGSAISNTTIYLLNAQKNIIEPLSENSLEEFSDEGDIYITAQHLHDCYVERTMPHGKIVEIEVNGLKVKACRTGDKGRWREDGELLYSDEKVLKMSGTIQSDGVKIKNKATVSPAGILPICISAHDSYELYAYLESYKEWFMTRSQCNLSQVAYSTHQQEHGYKSRTSIVADDLHDVINKVNKKLSEVSISSSFSAEHIAFLFPDQGAEVLQMGRYLYVNCAPFKKYFYDCANILNKRNINIGALITSKNTELEQPENAQVALFCISYALAKSMMDLNITPTHLLGQGVGELVCATIASVFPLADALEIVVARGKFIEADVDANTDMLELISHIKCSPPQLPFISCATNDWISAEQACDISYWSNQRSSSLDFSEGIAQLAELDNLLLIETGPGKSLTVLCLLNLSEKSAFRLISLLPEAGSKTEELKCYMSAIGKVWEFNVDVDWAPLDIASNQQIIELPSYPTAVTRGVAKKEELPVKTSRKTLKVNPVKRILPKEALFNEPSTQTLDTSMEKKNLHHFNNQQQNTESETSLAIVPEQVDFSEATLPSPIPADINQLFIQQIQLLNSQMQILKLLMEQGNTEAGELRAQLESFHQTHSLPQSTVEIPEIIFAEHAISEIAEEKIYSTPSSVPLNSATTNPEPVSSHTYSSVNSGEGSSFNESLVNNEDDRKLGDSFISSPEIVLDTLFDANNPPLEGARLGKKLNGDPAWFVTDPDRPGKYKMLVMPKLNGVGNDAK